MVSITSTQRLCLFKDLLGFALQLQQAVTLGEEFGQVMLVFHQMGRHDVIWREDLECNVRNPWGVNTHYRL